MNFHSATEGISCYLKAFCSWGFGASHRQGVHLGGDDTFSCPQILEADHRNRDIPRAWNIVLGKLCTLMTMLRLISDKGRKCSSWLLYQYRHKQGWGLQELEWVMKTGLKIMQKGFICVKDSEENWGMHWLSLSEQFTNILWGKYPDHASSLQSSTLLLTECLCARY